ncbi:MAG TPA: SufE family protein [Hyphomicrobiales bacterium]|nr:SufE family protein [Hyphomicrobiales bacterium]
MQAMATGAPAIADIDEAFSLLDEWEDRYRYLIELGRELAPMSESGHSPEHKVQGCVSQVWLETDVGRDAGPPVLSFRADSDSHLVRGLLAVLLALYSGRPAADILAIDAAAAMQRLGLSEHLTPQRSNGMRSVVARIRRDAEQAMATA